MGGVHVANLCCQDYNIVILLLRACANYIKIAQSPDTMFLVCGHGGSYHKDSI